MTPSYPGRNEPSDADYLPLTSLAKVLNRLSAHNHSSVKRSGLAVGGNGLASSR